MKHYVLSLDFDRSYEARCAEFRDDHLRRACALTDCGELMLAAALTDPLDTGPILFKGRRPEWSASPATIRT